MERGPFHDNWHLGALCEHLEAVSSGQIKKLIINIPPGHMKSLGVSVFWPAWQWIRSPSWSPLFSSYAAELSTRDSVRCRTLIESEWYQESFEPSWKLSEDENRADYFRNTEQGFRLALSVGGKTTGYRGHCIVADDPLNAIDSFSKASRERVHQWWSQSMTSRLNDKRTGAMVVIAQRLHQDDLPGYLLAQGGWDHLCLPSEFEPKKRCRTSIGFEDPRTEPGEPLFKEMYPKEVLAEAKKEMGSDGYAAQHGQDPAPPEGAMYKHAWFNRRWRAKGEVELEGLETRVIDPTTHRFRQLIISLDCSFKKTQDSDFVCAGVWGYDPPDRYLLDLMWDRMSFVDTVRRFADLCTKWPSARLKLIEEAANGPAVIEVLKRKFSGVVPVRAVGSKEARAAAVTPECEAGNVWLPAYASWVNDYLQEVCSFPKAAHDDTVDQMSHALLRLSPSSDTERLRKLVKW